MSENNTNSGGFFSLLNRNLVGESKDDSIHERSTGFTLNKTGFSFETKKAGPLFGLKNCTDDERQKDSLKNGVIFGQKKCLDNKNIDSFSTMKVGSFFVKTNLDHIKRKVDPATSKLLSEESNHVKETNNVNSVSGGIENVLDINRVRNSTQSLKELNPKKRICSTEESDSSKSHVFAASKQFLSNISDPLTNNILKPNRTSSNSSHQVQSLNFETAATKNVNAKKDVIMPMPSDRADSELDIPVEKMCIQPTQSTALSASHISPPQNSHSEQSTIQNSNNDQENKIATSLQSTTRNQTWLDRKCGTFPKNYGNLQKVEAQMREGFHETWKVVKSIREKTADSMVILGELHSISLLMDKGEFASTSNMKSKDVLGKRVKTHFYEVECLMRRLGIPVNINFSNFTIQEPEIRDIEASTEYSYAMRQEHLQSISNFARTENLVESTNGNESIIEKNTDMDVQD